MIHARDRARERLGLELTQKDLAHVRRLVRDRLACRWKDSRHGQERWGVTFAGREMVVVYDRRRDRICTVYKDAGRDAK